MEMGGQERKGSTEIPFKSARAQRRYPSRAQGRNGDTLQERKGATEIPFKSARAQRRWGGRSRAQECAELPRGSSTCGAVVQEVRRPLRLFVRIAGATFQPIKERRGRHGFGVPGLLAFHEALERYGYAPSHPAFRRAITPLAPCEAGRHPDRAGTAPGCSHSAASSRGCRRSRSCRSPRSG
jgi:hypothetical protein